MNTAHLRHFSRLSPFLRLQNIHKRSAFSSQRLVWGRWVQPITPPNQQGDVGVPDFLQPRSVPWIRQYFVQRKSLSSGAMIIDTPGMRELGLWDASEGVEDAFSDLAALAASCRFRDCSHTCEPGCAILRALEEGTADAKRVENYLRLRREADKTALKAELMRKQWKAAEKISQYRKISQYARQEKKNRR